MPVPAVHRGKSTIQKTLENICNAHAWHQHCRKSLKEELSKRIPHCCSNVRQERIDYSHGLSHHETKEMLGFVGPIKNFAPKLLTQHATTCNRVCEQMQHVTSNNVGSRWLTMLRPFARGLSYRLQLNLRNG